ncbi:MAG: thioredoxin [Alistipes sp.]|nr:thioredoxin [Candidatus Alistipes equi]
MVQELKNDNLEEVLNGGLPVVIDFSAEWCGPCQALAPIFEELAEQYADKVLFYHCDIDEQDEIVAQYRVRNIPTLVFIKNGEQQDKSVGMISKNDLKAKVDALL